MAEPQDLSRAEPSLARRGLRLIVELVRLHPGPFAVSVSGAALFAGGTVVSSLVLGRITDQVVRPVFATGDLPPHSLWWASAAVLAVAVIKFAGMILRRYFAGMTSERAQVSMRHRLVEQYLGLPLSWYQRTSTGQLLAHADSDTQMVSEVLGPLPFSLGVAFLALFSTVALVAVDPVMAAVALLIFPALALLNRAYSRRIERPAAEVQAGVGRVATIAHESFDGALVVKTLGLSEAERERFSLGARGLQASRLRVGFIRALFEAAMDSLSNLGIVAVVVLGAFRIQAGAMTQGDLVQVASLFTVLALPMRVFGYFLESVPPSVVSRERLAYVFDEPRPERPDHLEALPRGELAIEAIDVSFGYQPEAMVLAGVNLRIEAREVVAVVGSTGSGKSTLCTLLAGLATPLSGMVTVNDKPMEQLDPLDRTDAIALVFQESFLFADTVEANVDIGGQATEAEIWAALSVAQADRLVDELPAGLQSVLGERGVTLSGGQRQRVALARALLRRPRLLLLDDATSAVDAVIEQQILAGLRADLVTTTVIVAQRVSTIELADRVLYLSQGRIAAAGTHRELLTHPGYEALVRAYEEPAR